MELDGHNTVIPRQAPLRQLLVDLGKRPDCFKDASVSVVGVIGVRCAYKRGYMGQLTFAQSLHVSKPKAGRRHIAVEATVKCFTSIGKWKRLRFACECWHYQKAEAKVFCKAPQSVA